MCDRHHAAHYVEWGISRRGTLEYSRRTRMGPSAPHESTCESPLRRAGSLARPRSATATQSGARRSAVALVWHYGVLTAHLLHGVLHGTPRSTVSVGQVCAAASGCTRVRRCRAEHCTTAVHRFVRLGYLRGTQSVLTAYSNGSFVARRVLHTAVKPSIPCSARTAYSQGTQRVRKGYAKGTQRVLKRGTHRALKKRTQKGYSSGEGASGACGSIRGIFVGTARQRVCGALSARVGWGPVSGTHRLLAGTHRRTHMVLTGYSTGSASVGAGRYGRRQHVSVRLCALNRDRVLQGTARYSRAACVYYRWPIIYVYIQIDR